MVSGHYIEKKPTNWPIINFDAIHSILAPSASFLLEYLSVFLFSLLFVYLVGRFLKKKANLVLRFAYNLFAQTDSFFSGRSAVGLFFVSNLFFLFIVQQILANNVKTGESCSSKIRFSNSLANFSSSRFKLSNFQIKRESDRFGRTDSGHDGEALANQ